MQIFKKFFLIPSLITFLSLVLIFYFFGVSSFFAVLILIILEITLSFDNAVVNAKVLEKMDEVWRRRFINWGIWVAVFGTRVVLPIIIVALVSGLGVLNVLNLAIFDPATYGLKLEEAHYSIGAFGGIFLLLVALKYFIDDTKEIHWIQKIEKRLKKFSSIESIEIIFSLFVLLIISKFVPAHSTEILVAGIIGVILFVLMQGITNGMNKNLAKVSASGFGLFIYLNILDSAFSLDGVIGAFAISKNLIIIAVGLGIGAYFVRSFTLMMVEQKTLKELKYLEHGAHYAIAGLGLCMLFGLLVHIPEVVTGVIGLLFVTASYISSKKFAES
jgi:hypothetical protein